jgi:photosystem II stability/assembly factor-like uncharacterized protein
MSLLDPPRTTRDKVSPLAETRSSTMPANGSGPTQVLFPEAKQRERRRRLTKLGCLLVAIGLIVGLIVSFTGPPPHPSTPSPTISTHPPTSAIDVRPARPAGTAIRATALVDVSFPTPQSGFGLIGNHAAANGSSPTQLVTSSDGGATWHAIAGLLPYANRTLPNGISVSPRLAFATTSLGYSWDQAQIDVTTDGGPHWRVLPDPPGAERAYGIGPAILVGSSLWVAYGKTSCAGSFGCPSRIASWSPTSGWHALYGPSTSVATMTTYGSVVDIITTSPTAPGQTFDRDFRFLQVNVDGGPRGWQQGIGVIQCPTDSSFVDSVAALSKSTALVECVGDFEAGWAARSYWLTTDGGSQWTLRARSDAPPLEAVGMPPAGEEGTLAAGDGQFWDAGTRSTLYASGDGGLNWKTVGVTTDGAGGGGYIDFRRSDGWCVYEGLGLWRTSDGGATWQQLGASGVMGD